MTRPDEPGFGELKRLLRRLEKVDAAASEARAHSVEDSNSQSHVPESDLEAPNPGRLQVLRRARADPDSAGTWMRLPRPPTFDLATVATASLSATVSAAACLLLFFAVFEGRWSQPSETPVVTKGRDQSALALAYGPAAGRPDPPRQTAAPASALPDSLPRGESGPAIHGTASGEGAKGPEAAKPQEGGERPQAMASAADLQAPAPREPVPPARPDEGTKGNRDPMPHVDAGVELAKAPAATEAPGPAQTIRDHAPANPVNPAAAASATGQPAEKPAAGGPGSPLAEGSANLAHEGTRGPAAAAGGSSAVPAPEASVEAVAPRQMIEAPAVWVVPPGTRVYLPVAVREATGHHVLVSGLEPGASITFGTEIIEGTWMVEVGDVQRAELERGPVAPGRAVLTLELRSQAGERLGVGSVVLLMRPPMVRD